MRPGPPPQGLGAVGAAGEQGEAEAAGPERPGGGFADARGGTGDDGNAAGLLIQGDGHGMDRSYGDTSAAGSAGRAAVVGMRRAGRAASVYSAPTTTMSTTTSRVIQS